MQKIYDAIIIGAGHNGLVTAAYLAKAERSVLVVERRKTMGGAAATEEVFPGFQVNTGASDAGLFLPKIVADLNLEQHGLTAEALWKQVALLAEDRQGLAAMSERARERSRPDATSLIVREMVGLLPDPAVGGVR